jgi:hypothetical protein
MTLVQLIATLSAVGVSVVALAVSHRRAHQLFKQQQRDNVLPRLRVIVSMWLNYKAIHITNCGVGTAAIDTVSFLNGSKTSRRNLADLFDLPDGLHWDTWMLFHPEDTFLIRPGESVPLIQLSDEGLRAQQQSAEVSASILRSFHDELVGTEIMIHYSDIYGHPQDAPCSKVVRSATSTAYRPDASTGVGVL